MTGRLLAGGEKGKYTRAMLVCDRGAVLFDDVRQFGSVRWLAREPERLGPDALEISAGEFLGRLSSHKGSLKALLLNQSFLRGWATSTPTRLCFAPGFIP